MGEAALVALIAGAVTIIGVGVTSIFAFAGKKAELAQRAFERELQDLRDQVAAMRGERDHYRDRLEDLREQRLTPPNRRRTDPGHRGKTRPDTGDRRRFGDE